MTTLGSLLHTGRANGKSPVTPLDVPRLAQQFVVSLLAAGQHVPDPGRGVSLLSAMLAWTEQDDDAHEPCSLTACRHPLHPGPCKGWKGTLHSVAPGTYKQLEEERVRKANERRIKRIADLKAQGKPIPRRLLTEIQPKPAPTHPAHAAQAVPVGQVNQKADLAGGQAHAAGQAVSKAAGVQVKTAPPLPLGPKAKKPTVAGRGPAFVITQPKVTDQYKLDKAAKITPQEWDTLSDADKTTIRNELTAIKARGFGPQQTKADALLAKFPAPSAGGGSTAPAAPSTNAAPGKVSLGQAVKTPQLPAPPPAPTKGTRDQHGILNKPLPGGSVTSTSVGLPPGYRITRDGMGYSLKHNGKLIRTSATQDALEKYAHDHAKGDTSGHAPSVNDTLKTTAGPTPQAPAAPSNTPKAFPPHVQHARAVAGRALGGRPTAKTHVDAYDKLSKADFDSLDTATQRTIRDDLANAKGKFLDPKKQQAAQDLLNRFGSSHPTSAPATAPSGAKGYSDPMNQAMKEVRLGADRDELLKRVGALSPATIGNLTDDDRKALISRLALTATSRTATPQVKDRAAAYQRIIEQGSPAQKTLKLDHEPSLGELHAEETKTGIARAAVTKTDDALKAATAKHANPAERADRVKALTALDKAQFDDLKPDEQRKITDALQELHAEQDATTGSTRRDRDAGEALTRYTGLHPGVHRLQQAEADFRAGKIDVDQFEGQLRKARVQSPGSSHGSLGAALEKVAQRIAEDNPSLPIWLRSEMINNEYGGPGGSYHSIARAQSKFNFEPAPRLSTTDVSDIFRATTADLASVHPIHAEAVKELRQHLIDTGLRGQPGVPTGSPWSIATRNYVVDNLLHISSTEPEIPADRLAEFNALPPSTQGLVRRVLRDRLDAQTRPDAKTATWLSLRELEGRAPLTDQQRDAAVAATDSFPRSGSEDIYRKLDPNEFDDLPMFTRAAILAHLEKFQTQAERAGAVRPWSPGDNPLKVFPAALADHLSNMRTSYADRRLRVASDIANFGVKIINPFDRIRAYGDVPPARLQDMTLGDQDLIKTDLDKISQDGGLGLPLRYRALFTKDFRLQQGSHLNLTQLTAVASADPASPLTDAHVINNLGALDKAAYDKLDKTYRDAIDDRIKTLPAPAQQVLSAKFNPAAAPASPSGYTPTGVQPNVPPHVQGALDTIYGVHPKSHTMAHQLSTYGALRGSDFSQLNAQEQNHLLSDLSFIATTAKGPSADKAKKLIDRFTPPGTPPGQVPTPPVIPPANAVPGQVRYATPLVGTLVQAKDKGTGGDGWTTTPGGKRVWGKYGAAGLLLMHQDPQTGEKRYLMVQRGPAISDPGKWQFPGGAIDSKETFHQGGTREVIEELGFKADALKDALVHGEHTNAIPGSSWKYVSVAAQVPQMLKPDLSTHHARAETSDAKWMTEAEIRKLDTDGDLLAPLAGGKLEQNVLSLFPQGTAGTTLGQVARPGPVTKRLGRLGMPSGGRQAPTQFNAWPHAHKPSKGKDLIPDKATFDAQRQQIKNDRKLYDGKTADGRLAAIGAQQGYDDTPTVVDKKEIDRLLATGDYIEAWRGVSGAGGGWSARSRGGSGGKTAADINEDMRSGVAYYGKGIFGNGYYLATQHSVARQYADGTNGSIVRMLIPKSAVTQKYDKVSKESFASSSRSSKAKGAGYGETSTFWDPGRYAAAKGLDGIEIEPHHVSPSGGARHVAAAGKPAFNWLNRSVLIVQKEPG